METSPPVLQDSAFPSLSSIHSTQSNGNLNNSNLIPPLAPSHPISRKISDILTLHHHPLQTKAALEEIANLYPLDDSSDLVQKRELEEQEESSEEEEEDVEAGSNRNKPIARVDTQKARKNLEKDTDFNIEKATDDFLEVLRGVDQCVQLLALNVSSISQACSSIETKLSQAHDSTKYLLERAEGLTKQRSQLATQHSLSTLFLQLYTLSPSQLEVLESREPPSQELFSIMDRLEEIRSDAGVLLQGEVNSEGIGGGMKLGQDVISQSSSQLDRIYSKLSKYITFEFRKPLREGSEVGYILKESVMRLSKREELIRPALLTLSSTRSSSLSSNFLNALTIGGPAPSYLPKPIELHAYDPLRYVGDMLAWIHQALASEREWLSGVFLSDEEDEDGIEDHRSSNNQALKAKKASQHKRRIGERYRGLEGSLDLTNSFQNSSPFEKDPSTGQVISISIGERLVRELLDKNLQGCCRPLQIRVNQTVSSQEGCITTFKLSSLIEFYRITMERTIGTRARLSQTLREICQSSYEAFYNTLDRQASGLRRYSEPLPQDLSPPPPLLGSSSTLKELLTLHQAAVADDEDLAISKASNSNPLPSDPSQAPPTSASASNSNELFVFKFETVLEKLVEPMLSMCLRIAQDQIDLDERRNGRYKKDSKVYQEMTDKSKWESQVFLINCEGYVKSIISTYSFTSSRTQRIMKSMMDRVEGLIQSHFKHLLSESGLGSIIDAIDANDSGAPLSHHPECSPTQISSAFTQLNSFLSSPLLVTSPRLTHLSSPTLRSAIHQSSLERISLSYQRIVEAIQKPSNKYEWKETLVNRSVEEVELLLGVELRGDDVENFELQRIQDALA